MSDQGFIASGYVPASKRRKLAEQQTSNVLQGGLGCGTQILPPENSILTQMDSSQQSNIHDESSQSHTGNEKRSLLELHLEHTKKYGHLTEEEMLRQEEQKLLENLSKQQQKLASRKELAGLEERSRETIETGWTPPRAIHDMHSEHLTALRKKYGIAVNGPRLVPVIESFEMMRLPQPIISHLLSHGITSPKPVQMQGIPIALSGRDMIGIAQTGGGKTLVFAIPLVTLALRDEIRCPFGPRQGPYGIVIAPQRELASQIKEVVDDLCTAVQKGGLGVLTTLLCIGGTKIGDEFRKIPHGRGFHCLVGTPGRLVDMVKNNKISLDRCRFLALDEADRLVTDQFGDDIRSILDKFTGPRQTILFSATMPGKVRELATSAQIDPIILNVGQAGTANKDVTQTVESVPENDQAKMAAMLTALQKTPPPVLIFANSQTTVDMLYTYLRIKTIDAGCIHSGIDQAQRLSTIDEFKTGHIDVLVSTDLLAKGIDFGDKHIEHVINYDMPDNIEQYIHRVGRTGRAGRHGYSTTFVNSHTRDSLLLDLKHLLVNADQEIPPVLQALYDPMQAIHELEQEKRRKRLLRHPNGSDDDDDDDDSNTGFACEYCGGMGHRLILCPRLIQAEQARQGSSGRKFRMDSVRDEQ